STKTQPPFAPMAILPPCPSQALTAPCGTPQHSPSTTVSGGVMRVRLCSTRSTCPSSRISASFTVTCFCACAGISSGRAQFAVVFSDMDHPPCIGPGPERVGKLGDLDGKAATRGGLGPGAVRHRPARLGQHGLGQHLPVPDQPGGVTL